MRAIFYGSCFCGDFTNYVSEYVSELEKTKQDLASLRVENDTLKSEVNLLKDTSIPDKLAAAAKSDKVCNIPVKSVIKVCNISVKSEVLVS